MFFTVTTSGVPLEDTPPALLDAVRRAHTDGRPVRVVYAFGSRRGEERELTVIALGADGSSFTSREPIDAEDRTYVCSRILRLVDADGRVVTNPAAQARFDDYQGRVAESREALRAALAGTSPAWHKTFRVEPWAGAAPAPAGPCFQLHALDSGRSAVIGAPTQGDAETAAGLLHYLSGREGKGLFAAVPGMLQCQLDWPVWRRLHRSVVQEARLLRGGAPRLRDLPEGPQREAADAERFERYRSSTLRPLDQEHECVYYKGRVRLLEADWLEPAPARRGLALLQQAAHKAGDPDLGPLALSKYLFEIGLEGAVRRPSAQERTAPEWPLLEAAGLAVPMTRAADEELLRLLPQSALYPPLKARQKQLGKPASRDRAGCRAHIDGLDPDTRACVLSDIRQGQAAGERVLLRGLEGWSWEDTVDFRLLFTEMLLELHLWLAGGQPHRRLAEQLARNPV